MPDTSIHNNQPDAFSQKLRQKLEFYELPVDDGGWKKVNRELHPKKGKGAAITFLTLGVALAAAAMISITTFVLITNSVSDNKDNIPGSETVPKPQKQLELQEESLTDTTSVGGEALLSPILKNEQEQNGGHNVSLSSEAKNAGNKTKTTNGTVRTNNNSSYSNDNSVSELIKNSHVALPTQTTTDENEPSVRAEMPNPEKEQNEVSTGLPDGNYMDAIVDAANDTSLLAELQPASNNDSRSQESVQILSDTDAIETDKKDTGEKFTEQGTQDQNRKMPQLKLLVSFDKLPEFNDGMPPMSIGLLYRTNANARFALETGLIFTHLQTDYALRNSTLLGYTANLDYLGVPVRLIGRIWKKNRWNTYFSVGMQAEKGLRMTVTEYEYVYRNYLEVVNHAKYTSSISGWQFSAYGALGVSYNISKSFGIFIEPSLRYNFNADQPVSTYTEKSFIFGFTGGLQVNF